MKKGPLAGVRVLELGNFIAGPYCGTILAYFGAEVIKIEPLGAGDQIRKFRDVDPTGTSWWWYSLGRNKKSVCVDLRNKDGQSVIKDLIKTSDVLVENFRPGTMEKWNMGSTDLKAINSKLIYTSISGYGQTGPYASRPGFASACEAMGGFRYVNGFSDKPNCRPNLSLGDTLAGQNAAMGTLLALYAREKVGVGQVVDTAIYESVFNVMEGCLPDFSGAGIVRQPSGSTVTGIVPTNTYKTKDGKSIVIGANSDALFKRLMKAIGREDMAKDAKYADNQNRVTHQKYIDEQIEKWTLTQTAGDVQAKVEQAEVPNGLIYSIADIASDPQYVARQQIETVHIKKLNRDLQIPAIGPKLSETPGGTKWPGREIGEDTKEVLMNYLKYDDAKYNQLLRDKVIQ